MQFTGILNSLSLLFFLSLFNYSQNSIDSVFKIYHNNFIAPVEKVYRYAQSNNELSLKEINKVYRVALQVGHWKNDELPDELSRLRTNDGATSGNLEEWQVNYKITILLAQLLENEGITVDILPATVPPQYTSDIFISVHTDMNKDRDFSGFKASTSIWDNTGKGKKLAAILEHEFKKVSFMPQDLHYTRNMKEYYAFNQLRFKHTIHPDTIHVVVEMGFLSNTNDNYMIINHPDIPARGLKNGIISFLNSHQI